jgi:hypothetical protein
VLDGGRLATFGVETLRRGVTLRANAQETAGELLRPTQPAADDPFGAVLDPLRRESGPVPIEQVAGDPAFGLVTGFDGTLEGFSAFEESAPPDPDGRARVLVALGEPPPEPDPEAPPDEPLPEERHALTAMELGKGFVIRVGLPQWTAKLGEQEVAQITRNIADLLRKAPTKIRG